MHVYCSCTLYMYIRMNSSKWQLSLHPFLTLSLSPSLSPPLSPCLSSYLPPSFPLSLSLTPSSREHTQSPKQKWRKRHHMLTQQELLLGELKAIMATISNLKDDRPKRVRGMEVGETYTHAGF